MGIGGEPRRLIVLIVEDEPQVSDVLRIYFERDGFTVLATGRGAEAIDIVRMVSLDLIILDLRLPDVPGEFVATEVRKDSEVPMMMLTAKTSESDRIRGLQLGADDYISKPFSPTEVVLRAKAVLQRRIGERSEAARSFGGGEVVLDYAHGRVMVRGDDVELTPTEWSVLRALARSGGRVMSRRELSSQVRGCEFRGDERMVDSHIKNLRRKVEFNTASPVIVETVLGIGYRLGLRPDE